MYINYILFYLIAIVSSTHNGKKSFTLVLDTTTSMRAEIDILRSNLDSVVNKNLNDINSFILIPFDDPEFGPPIKSPTADGLIGLLNYVEVSGGNDCPENSLPAIEKAISVSEANSFVFVFTDGYANDNSKLRSIKELCQSKNTQIIIFLSGKCVQTDKGVVGSIDTYFDVAKACFGTVLQYDLSNFRQVSLEETRVLEAYEEDNKKKFVQVFKFMKELIQTEWTDVNAHNGFIGSKLFVFSVDMFTKDLVLAVSGYYPTVGITDENGYSVPIEKIVTASHSLVVRIKNLAVGNYKANIFCQGLTMATFYRRKELKFQYGFSPKIPMSMKETSSLPIPGATSFICISVAQKTIELVSVHISFDGSSVKTIDVDIIDASKGLYAAKEFFDARKSFKITIFGRDSSSFHVIKGNTGTLKPQRQVQAPSPVRPKIELIEPETALVDYNSNFTVACKVSGYPKPTITWQDDEGNVLQSEDLLLETPNVFISYAYIERVSKNSTIYCKCESFEGEDTLTMSLFVNRTIEFNVIKYPEDAKFEYGSEGRLYCKVDAYPDAFIKWYHNESLVEDSDYLEVIPDDDAILIKNMTLDTTGEYKCEIRNSIEKKSYIAIVDIDIDAPEISLSKSEVVLKPGDFENVECIVNRGKPEPVVNWKFITANDNEEIPEGVTAEDNFLKIPSAKAEHMGVYKCEASNVAGSDSKELQVKIQYAPKIKIYNEIKVVKEGDEVELLCEVDAIPKAHVWWDLTQGDLIVPLENRHETDERNTHRFIALSNDSGNYHCIAENEVGKAESTVTVNVLVEPYIEPAPTKIMTLRPGDTETLPCIVNRGDPVPTTKWEFIASNSSVTTLLRGKSTTNLMLQNVSRQHEGSYICVAENPVGSDSIKIIVKVL